MSARLDRCRLPLGVAAGFALAVAVLVAVPQTQAATSVHLTAAGDYGARDTTNSVLAAIKQANPDAHFALGDLKYGDVATEQAWCSFVKAQVGEGFPFQLVSGNHESLDVADGAINNFSACLPNQIPGAVGTYGREYYVDLPAGNDPQVRVIGASPTLTFEDGKWAYADGSDHLQFVSDAIDSGRAKGARWIVVAAHIPCQTVGTNTCPVDRDFYELMAEKKVDLVLHGHEHGYMRTHQLRSGTAACPTIPVGSFDPDCVLDSDNSFVAGTGTVFATVGTGGTPLRNVSATDPEVGYFAAYSGLNSNPTYGLLDMNLTDTTLTARFVGTSGGNFTDQFTITKPEGNLPPTASFTAGSTGLTASFDASASTDPDGTIASYAWDWGDGTAAGSGRTPQHTYATGGTYQVRLTVTDDDGTQASTTRDVTVAPASSLFVTDRFGRTVANGWGTSDVGGPWTIITGAASNFAVNGTVGRITTTAGSMRGIHLGNIRETATEVRGVVNLDKAAAGGSAYTTVIGRRVNGTNDYRLKLQQATSGTVTAILSRLVNNTEATISSAVMPGGAVTAGGKIQVRFQVDGTSPTALRARVWKDGAAEPAAWLLNANDTTAALQAQGGVGLLFYLSGSTTNAPNTLVVDDLLAGRPSAL